MFNQSKVRQSATKRDCYLRTIEQRIDFESMLSAKLEPVERSWLTMYLPMPPGKTLMTSRQSELCGARLRCYTGASFSDRCCIEAVFFVEFQRRVSTLPKVVADSQGHDP